MDKKGFTLVELIAVIVLLAATALIAVPIVNRTIKNSKEKAYNAQKAEIVTAAKKYVLENGITVDSEPVYITLRKLVSNSYFEKGNIYDPRNEENLITKGVCVKVTYEEASKSYKYAYENPCTKNFPKFNHTLVVNDVGEEFELDLGDEIQIEGENFYVVENKNGKLTLMGKYNLDVGKQSTCATPATCMTDIANPTGIQNSKAKGFDVEVGPIGLLKDAAFPDFDGDIVYKPMYGIVEYADINTYANNYKTILTNKGLNIVTARPVMASDLLKAGCSEYRFESDEPVGGYTCLNYKYEDAMSGGNPVNTLPEWLTSTSYWLGDVFDNSYFEDYDGPNAGINYQYISFPVEKNTHNGIEYLVPTAFTFNNVYWDNYYNGNGDNSASAASSRLKKYNIMNLEISSGIPALPPKQLIFEVSHNLTTLAFDRDAIATGIRPVIEIMQENL